MANTKGVEIMKEVIGKLSKGRVVSHQLREAFETVRSGCDTDFCGIDFHDLQILTNEYDNQIKYETSTVDSGGELNTPYQSLFQLYSRLRSLAERVIKSTGQGEG